MKMEKKRKRNEQSSQSTKFASEIYWKPNIEFREIGKIKQTINNKFQVSMTINKKRVKKIFDNEKSAIEYKTRQNEIYDLKKKYHFPQSCIPLERLEFIASFGDGDAEISIDKKGVVRFQFFQSKKFGEPPELLHIQSLIGGNITSTNKKDNPNWRKSYVLNINTENLELIISLLIPFSIVKKPQLIVVQEYLKIKEKTSEIKSFYYEKMKNLKKEYFKIKVDKDELNDVKIAGFFASEGMIRMCESTLIFKITQTGCSNLLHAIKDYFQFGKVTQYKKKDKDYLVCNENALTILNRIRPFIIGQKIKQINKIFDFMDFKKTHEYKKNPKKAKLEIKKSLYSLKRS